MDRNKEILANYNIYFEVFINGINFVFYDSSTAMAFLNNAILGCRNLDVLESLHINVKYEYKGVDFNDRTAD